MVKLIEMPNTDEKKHVVKYSTNDSTAAVQNVYVERAAFPDGMPKKLFMAISEDPIELKEAKKK